MKKVNRFNEEFIFSLKSVYLKHAHVAQRKSSSSKLYLQGNITMNVSICTNNK